MMNLRTVPERIDWWLDVMIDYMSLIELTGPNKEYDEVIWWAKRQLKDLLIVQNRV